jgi:endonuclease-3
VTRARAEKAARIRTILGELYPAPPIPLGHEDPFTLLVAVVLSAQCTDARVNEVTPRLFARARTPEAMARLRGDIDSIVPVWTRHDQHRALSQLIVERPATTFPRPEELEALPGVGHKTASVVMSQAFGVPAFPVDTHIHRLAARWGLSSGRSVVQTERDLKRLFPGRLGAVHLQIIYFRASIARRAHDGAVSDLRMGRSIDRRSPQPAGTGSRRRRSCSRRSARPVARRRAGTDRHSR